MRVESSLVNVTDGTVYELLKISEVPAGALVAPVLSFQEGVPSLPCRLSAYDRSGDALRLVAAYPSAAGEAPRCVLGAFGADGDLLDQQEVRAGAKRASLASKVQRRLRPEALAELARADERSRDSYGPSLDLVLAVAAKGHLILKCRLTLPDATRRGDVSLAMVSDDMSWACRDYTVLSETSVAPAVEGAPQELRMGFSVRIPWDKGDVSLVAHSARTGEVLHVERVPRATRDALQAYTDRLLYRHAELDPYYDEWFRAHRAKGPELDLQRRYPVPAGPWFSVVVPLGEPASRPSEEALLSVVGQSYPRWELVLLAPDPGSEGLRAAIELVRANGGRARVARPDEPLRGPAGPGAAAGAGDYVCLLDRADVLEPNALFEFARAITADPSCDLLYCDEDKIGAGGAFVQPFFKPDLDLDLLRSTNYVGRSPVVSRRLFDEFARRCAPLDAAGVYDLVLRATERTAAVRHLPAVLVHRLEPGALPAEVAPAPCPSQRALEALRAHLARLGLCASVCVSERNTLRVTYDVPEERPLVSIVIPTKNNAPILRRCVESILSRSTYQNLEVLLVDNGSTEAEVDELYASIADERVSVLRYDVPFNFSAIVNHGVRAARGDYLLLLNNDTEVITPDWIEVMLGTCARGDVGAVGAKLLYPDGTIQHAGVNITGGPVHLFSHLPNGARAYHDFSEVPRDLSAVTAACMMVRRDAFWAVGGFDEELAVTFNDVDFCLKLRDAGYLVVYSPYAELYHYESISRGADDDLAGRTRSLREKAILLTRWPEPYVLDPYYSPSPRQGNPDGAYYVF